MDAALVVVKSVIRMSMKTIMKNVSLILLVFGLILIGSSFPVLILGKAMLPFLSKMQEHPDSLWFVFKMRLDLVRALPLWQHLSWMAGMGCLLMALIVRSHKV